MATTPKQIPPEAFDGYDCQPRKPLSPDYMQQALPEHLRTELAKRKPAEDDAPLKSE